MDTIEVVPRGAQIRFRNTPAPDFVRASSNQPTEYATDAPGSLVPCGVCGRKFSDNRIAKHEAACKHSQAKRPAFNASSHRATEEMQAAPRGKDAEPAATKEMPEWKKKHEDFVNNMRYANKITALEAKGGDIRTIAPPKMNIDLTSEYEECPYCSRKFN
jgi:uncharacterized CHY-type Zn-finger protein